MAKLMMLEPYQLLLGGVVAIAFLTVGLTVGVSNALGRNILKPRQFTCQPVIEPQTGELMWTVFHQGQGQPQPWLQMVPGMEGDVSPKSRCEQVAQRLDSLVPQQLRALTYQPNPATPEREAICALTQTKGGPCTTLLILKPETDPTQFFADLTLPLRQWGEGMQLETANQVPLDLQPYLLEPASP
ncbi:hypothetical protein FEK30_04850 [Picosynechococcus sp. PCC 11901]|uniref:COP23 domain-containing protein n=1 Tax=unclassified Picosynechococcus TaxID=3079910 RepID=UPI0009FCA125|nr:MULTISPECIES: COP23 domain-containing protein [unclassified Picosynechococcus]QCS48817.1 hypothetical protein FEK30_04850 [Picosynechococcus sp. PCC 11901]